MTVILKELVEILTTLLELPVKLSAFLDMDAKLCCVGMDVFLLSCVPYNSKNSRFQTTTYFFWEDRTVWLYPLKLRLFFGVVCSFWHLMGNSVCCVVDSTIVFSSWNMILGVYHPISDCMALGSEFRICHTWCLHSETLFQVISKFFIGWSAIK